MVNWRRPIYFLVWCIEAPGLWVQAWFFTRTPRWLVQGLPAVFVAGACVTVMANFGIRPRVHVLDRYNAAIDDAMRRGDYEAAELYLHKLLQLDESRADVRYRLAQLAQLRGEWTRAGDMMEQLAPTDSTGHPGAHFWVAKQQLATQQRFTEAQTDQLIHHLTAALHLPTAAAEAHALLGQLYVARRDYDQAVEHFSAIVDAEPRWRLVLAKAHLAHGNRSRAHRELSKACEEFQKQVGADSDNVNARLALAEAWALQDNLDKAERILIDGLGGSDALRVRQALAAVYVMRFDSEGLRQRDEGARLALLESALQYAPNHIDALLRLTTYLKHDGPEREAAKERIEEALAEGKAPAIVHLVLGTNAAQEGNMALAKMHLEQAYRLEPQASVVLNNLAWVLARQDPPQYEEALMLASEALDRSPNNAEIRETRGQILARMERWSEALVDLELALGKMPDNAALHKTVAEAYSKLGNDSMAERHRMFSEQAAAKKVDRRSNSAKPR
jgi:tetratricopeptide (TPR) repeat protein